MLYKHVDQYLADMQITGENLFDKIKFGEHLTVFLLTPKETLFAFDNFLVKIRVPSN